MILGVLRGNAQYVEGVDGLLCMGVGGEDRHYVATRRYGRPVAGGAVPEGAADCRRIEGVGK